MDRSGLVPERDREGRKAGFQLAVVLARGWDSGPESAADCGGPFCLPVLRSEANAAIVGHYGILFVVFCRRDGIGRGLYAGASSHGGIVVCGSRLTAESLQAVRSCCVFTGRNCSAGGVVISWVITTRNDSEGSPCQDHERRIPR